MGIQIPPEPEKPVKDVTAESKGSSAIIRSLKGWRGPALRRLVRTAGPEQRRILAEELVDLMPEDERDQLQGLIESAEMRDSIGEEEEVEIDVEDVDETLARAAESRTRRMRRYDWFLGGLTPDIEMGEVAGWSIRHTRNPSPVSLRISNGADGVGLMISFTSPIALDEGDTITFFMRGFQRTVTCTVQAALRPGAALVLWDRPRRRSS